MRAVSPSRRVHLPLELLGWAVVGLFGAPFAYLLVRVGDASGLSLSSVAQPLARSLTLAVVVSLLAMATGTALAWLSFRTDMPLARVFRVVAALPLAIPSYVAAAGVRAAFGKGGLIDFIPRPNGFVGSVLVLVAVTYPYVYLPVGARLRTLPGPAEEAGHLLGSSTVDVMRRIVMPQVRGSVLAGGLIAFLYTLSDFGAVSLLRYDTITRVIYTSRLTQQGLAITLALILGILAITLAILERQLGKDEGGVDTEHGVGRTYRLGKARIWAGLGMASFMMAVLLTPVVVFGYWWWRGSIAAGSSYPGFLGAVGELVMPMIRTGLSGVVAGAAAALIVLPLVYLNRRRSIAGAVGRVVVSATFAIPGLVLALSAVYLLLSGPRWLGGLYQGFTVLILVYVVHFGVQAHRASAQSVESLPARYGDAAGLLGAGRWRRFRTIDAPLIAPGVVAGGGLVMLSVMKELPVTLLLAPIGFETLATRIWGAAEEGFLGDVGAASLMLVAISALLTWLLVLRPLDLTSDQETASAGSGAGQQPPRSH